MIIAASAVLTNLARATTIASCPNKQPRRAHQVIQDRVHSAGQLTGAFGFLICA